MPRMWRFATLAVVAAGTLPSAGPSSAPTPQLLALTHATVFDAVSGRARHDRTVVIEAGRIRAIQGVDKAIPAGARIVDLRGAWALPGLIDAHVHLRDDESARRALRGGVTTARSLGVDRFVDVGMARRQAAGAKDLPEVIAAGYHVRPQLADSFFLDFPALRRLASGVSDAAAVREVVRANASRGVRFIKVMATQRAGTPDTDFRWRALGDGELAAAASEARKLGLAVAAHAHTDEGAAAAVLAGARTIEHGTMASPATLRQMRSRGACLVPTLSFWADMAGPGGEYDHPRLAERARATFPNARMTVARARRASVTIAAGSDMRYDRVSPFGLVDELMLLQRSGLSPVEALRAGTSNAAACIGVGARTGSLRPGMEADLLIVDGDPTKDLSRLRLPRMVINDGVIVDR